MLNRNWFTDLFQKSSFAGRPSRKQRKRVHQLYQRKNLRAEALEPRIVLSGTSLIEPAFDAVSVAASTSSPVIAGDLDTDGDADGGDFLAWQRGLYTATSTSDLADWQDSFGAVSTENQLPAAISGSVGFENLQAGVWHEIDNTDLQQLAPPNDGDYDWNEFFGGGVANSRGDGGFVSWSGGAFDTQRNRLLVWGGGHSDYAGNGVYAFDIDTLAWERVTLPSLPTQAPSQFAIDNGLSCNLNQSYTCASTEANPNGTPTARHTYDSIAYIPGSDQLLGAGGSRWADGAITPTTWTLDLAQTTGQTTGQGAWVQGLQDIPEINFSFGFYSAYDSASGNVYYSGANHLLKYNPTAPSSSAWSTVTAAGSPVNLGVTPIDQHVAEIDPVTHKMVVIGGGAAYYFDLSDPNNVTRHDLVTIGDNAIINTAAPGLEYNSATGTFFAWSGGSDLYELDLRDSANATWAKHTIGAGSGSNLPPASVPSGTFGRFQYIEGENAFVLANGVKENVFVYKVGPSTPIPASLPVLEVLEVRDADGDGTNDSINHVNELVHASLPLPEGSGIFDVNQLALQGVPDAQFRVLSTYPSNEIRWVEIDFLATLNANGAAEFQLIDLGAPAANTDLAQQVGSRVDINTGAGQFVVNGDGNSLLSSAIVSGVQQLGSPLEVYSTSGSQTFVQDSADTSVVIEENGPVTTVVKVDGRLRIAGGGAQHLWYTARLQFVKDSSEVKTELTFRNADEQLLADQVFDSYGARFKIATANPTVTFRTEDGQDFSGSLSGAQTALIYQGFDDNHPFNQSQQAIGLHGCGADRRINNASGGDKGNGWVSPPVAGTCSGTGSGSTFTYDSANKGTRVVIAGTTQLQGGNSRSVSFAKVVSGSQSITLAQRYMANYFPASFEIDGSGQVDIGLHSEHSGKLNQEFYWGQHTTREFTVAFGNSDSAAVRRNLDFPLVARSKELDYYRIAGALPGEKGIASFADQELFFSDRGEIETNLGTAKVVGPPQFEVKRTSDWQFYYRDYTRDIIDFWRAESDFAASYFFQTQETAKFEMDTAVARSDGFDLGAKPDGFLPTNLIRAQKGVNTYDSSHQLTRYLPVAYYLTGNERIKEGIFDYAEEQYFDDVQSGYFSIPFHYEFDARGFFRRIQNYPWFWEFTGETRYLNRMEEGLDLLLSSNAQVDPGGRGQDPDRGFVYIGGVSNSSGRLTHTFFDAQVAGGAYFDALNVLRNNQANLSSTLRDKIEDLEDVALGHASYLYREIMKGGTDRLFEDYGIDSAGVFPAGDDASLYTASRFAVHIYDMFGSRLLDGADVFDQAAELDFTRMRQNPGNPWLESWMSDPMRQAMIYTDRFNPAPLHGYKEITSGNANLTVTPNGNGSYDLSWTVPQGATGYRIKAAQGKQIVDWLGFDRVTRNYDFSPVTNVPWFAAQNLRNEPAPIAEGTTQTWTVPASQLGGTGWNFSVFYETTTSTPPVNPPPQVVQEDGNSASDWIIYDNNPVGQQPASIVDPANGSNNVIQLQGGGWDTGYRLDFASPDTNSDSLEWRINYSERYTVYVNVQTANGQRFLAYSSPGGAPQSPPSNEIHHEAGLANGQWNTITRNLLQDLQAAEPGNTLVSIDSFSIRGSGLVDDIVTFAEGTVPTNNAPTANSDFAVTDEGVLVTTVNVLANDTDPDPGDVLSVLTFTQPSNGLVTNNGNGTFDYTPNGTFFGSDSFTYTVTDGQGGTDVGTVNVTVNEVVPNQVVQEDAENGNTNGWATPVGGNFQGTVSNVLDPVNSSNRVISLQGDEWRTRYTHNFATPDTDSDSIEWKIRYSEFFSAEIELQTSAGTQVLLYQPLGWPPNPSSRRFDIGFDKQNGQWHTISRNLLDDLQAAVPGATLVSINSFSITGSGFVDDIITFADNPVPVNTAPTANPDFAVTDEGVLVTTPNVLANDTDPDPGDVLSVLTFTQANNGLVSDNGNGTFDYTPNGTFFGSDSFTYTVTDGQGGTDVGTVNLTVNMQANSAPVAVDDPNVTTDPGVPVVIDVLANDFDPDGDTFDPFLVTSPDPAKGFLSFDPGSKTFSFHPNTDFSGIASFTYELFDIHGAQSATPATVTITANSVTPGQVIQEDAEDGNTNGWAAPVGGNFQGVVSNVLDPVNSSNRVISLQGDEWRTRYTYNFATPDTASNSIEWKMKYSEFFSAEIELQTSAGTQVLLYQPLGWSPNPSTRRFDIGFDKQNGQWHTVSRNLLDDLQAAVPGATLVSINSFSITGSGFIDDIATFLDLPAFVIQEDAEDGNTNGWTVYQEGAFAGSITNVTDPVNSSNKAISLQGDIWHTGYRFDFAAPDTVYDSIEWRMKYSEFFSAEIEVQTSAGLQRLIYQPYNWDSGLMHGIGPATQDGQWHTINRNLAQDLQDAVPGATLDSIVSFSITGSGLIDDIKTLIGPPASSALATGIAGDLNSDGSVGGADFLQWQRGYGVTTDVNILADWKDNFGATALQASALSTGPVGLSSASLDEAFQETESPVFLLSLDRNSPRVSRELTPSVVAESFASYGEDSGNIAFLDSSADSGGEQRELEPTETEEEPEEDAEGFLRSLDQALELLV